MARGLSATIQSRLASLSQVKVFRAEITTPSSTVYYTDAPFDVDFNSNTYEAQADFLAVSNVEENAELIITGLTLSISGLKTANIQTFATSGIINKEVIMRSAYLDPTDNSIIDTPIIMFKGKISGYGVEDARDTCTIALNVSSTFANFDKVNGRRTNQDSFHREHPQDDGMEYSYRMLEEIKWGKT